MAKMVRIERVGGPAVMKLVDQAVPAPGPGEVRVRQTAIGVNFVDIYHRTGAYPLPGLPSGLGVEAAGEVEAVGEGVSGFAVGDRVAYGGLPPGSYAESRLVPTGRLLSLPAAIAPRLAAAALLRGLTAWMVLHRVCSVRPGQTILIHAAAGGVGVILTQWARRLGAVTIGTVGSEQKAALARAHGLDHAVLYRQSDFVAAVRDLTEGRGVDYAVDGIGGATLPRTLSVVRPFGMVASLGQTAGPIAPLDIGALRGIGLSRPSVLGLISDGTAYREAAAALFAVLADGLRVEIGAEYPLDAVAKAHEALEAGRTMGSVLLTP